MTRIFVLSLVFILGTVTQAAGTNYYKQYSQSSEQSIRNMLVLYKKNPSSYYVNVRLGYLYYSIKKYANAEHHYQEAAKKNSRSVEPLLGLYLIYASQKEYGKAENYLEDVLKIDPNNYYGNYYMTYCLMYQLKYNSAKKVAIKMLRMYPSDTNFLYALQGIYLATNRKSDAEKIGTYISTLTK